MEGVVVTYHQNFCQQTLPMKTNHGEEKNVL